MGKTMTKAMLISELASATQIDKPAVTKLLQTLTDLAYREAHNGFVIPGICKLKVVSKKATQCRNPVTGRLMHIGDREILKILPVKAAKDTITPKKDHLVTVIEEPAAIEAPAAAPAPPVAEAAAAAPAPQPEATPSDGDGMVDTGLAAASEEGQILFECSECKSMLSAAPSEAGMDGKCPYCDNPIHVPEQRAPLATPGKEAAARNRTGSAHEFVSVICETCNQEIEAPTEMIGMEVSCPSCSTPLTVPDAAEAAKQTAQKRPAGKRSGADSNVDLSSMTIRIDLSDLE